MMYRGHSSSGEICLRARRGDRVGDRGENLEEVEGEIHRFGEIKQV